PTAWFEDALRIFREIDESAGVGWMLSLLAEEQLKAGDVEGAASRATETLDLGIRLGQHQLVAQSRRMLALVAAQRGQHADAERLLAEAAVAYEEAGDRWQLAVGLAMRAHLAFDRGDGPGALGPLRQALRLARDSGLGAWMAFAVELAAHVLHHRGRARDVAALVGAVEAIDLRVSGKEM